MKFTAWFITNSVGILTDAMESIVNVMAGAISLYCIYLSSKPKDKDHPFGHGKIELISASIEGILIIVAGGLIIYKAIQRLLNPDELMKLDTGIIIVAVSGLMNYVMGWYSVKTGKKHGSMALIAEGKHLQSDTYSTIGLLIGLSLLYFTGIEWIDGAMAMVFGAIIIITGVSILRKTMDNLLDRADVDLLNDMVHSLNERKRTEWIDIHSTKAIKYGNCLYMDCDITLPWFLSIEQGHKIGIDLKRILQEKYSDSLMINIHFDPCNVSMQSKCHKCGYENCKYRKEAFSPECSEITLGSLIDNEQEEEN